MFVVKNLSVCFHGKKILHDVSLRLAGGTITALLGCNGAGKTTLLRSLLHLERLDSGGIFFDDKPLSLFSPLIKKIGYAGQHFSLIDNLTGRECLEYYARLSSQYSQHELQSISEQFFLTSFLDQRIHTYSMGTKQRFHLACSMIHRPRVLIRDEPFNYLDPLGKKCVTDVLSLCKKNNVAILFSTHLLSEIEHIVDYVHILDAGSIVYADRYDHHLSSLEKVFFSAVSHHSLIF